MIYAPKVTTSKLMDIVAGPFFGMAGALEKLDVKAKESYIQKAVTRAAKDALAYHVDVLRKSCASGWISVKERLPEEGGYYLLAFKNFRHVRGGYFEKGFFMNCAHIKLNKYNKVTHWMPIPDPPEVE